MLITLSFSPRFPHPLWKRRTPQICGVRGLFHRIHTPYYCNDFIIYSII